MKKIISTILAIDFALGFCTYGSNDTFKRKPAKETTAISTVSKNPYEKNKLGKFYITFYVPDEKWGYQTATQEMPIHLKTCAVDPSLIPYGSVLLVKGENGKTLTLRANDCGNFGGKQLDIFWDRSVKEGYAYFGDFGEYATVYLLEE